MKDCLLLWLLHYLNKKIAEGLDQRWANFLSGGATRGVGAASENEPEQISNKINVFKWSNQCCFSHVTGAAAAQVDGVGWQKSEQLSKATH